MEKVLITGGAGFIGSNLAAYYLKRGWQVIVYDNLSRKNADKNLAWLKSLKKSHLQAMISDIREYKKLEKAVKQAGIIFHLAAQVAVTKSIKNPREDFEVNTLGTFNLLEAARKAGHRPIVIHASTNKVYGQLDGFSKPVSEKQPLEFHSPYACSKGAAEQYVQDYARTFALPTVVFRQSCIYGTRQFGEEDQGWVAHFIISGVFDRPITIYGDGQQVRDILEVGDLIRVFKKAVKNIKDCQGQAYNIGGGPKNTTSLLELISDLEKILGKKINYSFAKPRIGDQKFYVSDINKAKKELGWQPLIGKKEGINRLHSWVKNNKNLFS